MKRVLWQKRIRRWHRYLGVIFGIQFLFWTIGGLYFSWTNIKSIRGDDVRQELPMLTGNEPLVSPSPALAQFRAEHPHAQIMQLTVQKDAKKHPVYLLRYHEHHEEHHVSIDAVTGARFAGITQDEAVAIAIQSTKGNNSMVAVNRITRAEGSHEYREKPLPAYAVVLRGDVQATVYVGEETGMVHAVRNNQWRVFDFLWMLHIMDFKSRDDINNWLLRFLSAAGLITLCSGYILFFLSRKKTRRQ